MRKQLSRERGNVMVTAILLLSIMLTIGLAVLSQADSQTSQSRIERERESTFNLAEAALSAQTFILGRRGTGIAGREYPLDGCPTSGDPYFCPLSSQIEKSYNGAGQVDFDASTTWRTHVRDDRDPVTNEVLRFWDEDILNPASSKYAIWPRYDADGNRHVWVRSEAVVRGRKRAIIAWVRIEDRVVSFPQYAILAGYVRGKNSGGHGGRPLVDGSPLGVAVRCNEPFPPQSSCVDLNPTKGPQIQPPGNVSVGYPRPRRSTIGRTPGARGRGASQRDLLLELPVKSQRRRRGGGERRRRYTNSAPAAPGGSKCCNTQANPGLYILKRGTVDFGGNIEFWGVVYNANLDNSTAERLVETSGTSAIRGGVLVDGNGGVYAGSSGDNIVYNAFAFQNITAIGTAGVVQNTWREIVNPR